MSLYSTARYTVRACRIIYSVKIKVRDGKKYLSEKDLQEHFKIVNNGPVDPDDLPQDTDPQKTLVNLIKNQTTTGRVKVAYRVNAIYWMSQKWIHVADIEALPYHNRSWILDSKYSPVGVEMGKILKGMFGDPVSPRKSIHRDLKTTRVTIVSIAGKYYLSTKCNGLEVPVLTMDHTLDNVIRFEKIRNCPDFIEKLHLYGL